MTIFNAKKKDHLFLFQPPLYPFHFDHDGDDNNLNANGKNEKRKYICVSS